MGHLWLQAHSVAPLIERADEWIRDRPEAWAKLRHRTEVAVQEVMASRGIDVTLDPSGSLARALLARNLVQSHVRAARFS